jgi:hypothetical protein
MIAQDNNTLVIPEAEFATSVVAIVTGALHPRIGQDLGIRLVNLNVIPDGFTQATSPDLEVDFDDIILRSTAVNEASAELVTGLAVNPAGSDALITWATDPGFCYTLLRTADLSVGFTNMIGGARLAGAASITVTDDVTGVDGAYYQVIQP